MSEKTPRLRPSERVNPRLTSVLAHRTMEAAPVLNPDQQRRIGQMSLTDGMPIVREAPEGYTPWPIGAEGLAKIKRERDS